MNRTNSANVSKTTRCGTMWSAALRCWGLYKHNWQLFLFGQSIALSLAMVSSASSTIEAQYGVVLPTTMSGIVYFLLSFHLLHQFMNSDSRIPDVKEESRDLPSPRENGFDNLTDINSDTSPPACALPFTSLRAPWWNYLIVAVLDVEANFIFMQAFRYTSLTSAQLLSSLAVPSAMLFSRLILRRVFRARHFFGAITCLSGGVIMLLSDFARHRSEDEGSRYSQLHPHSFVGDLFAVIGAAMYGLTDTLAERFVKNVSRVEYLGMLGFFGALVSFLQVAVVEREELAKLMDASIFHQIQVLLIVGWYVACLLYVYIGFSHFLAIADVTLLILSLQTSQGWATLFSVVVQRISPTPSFYCAVIFMVSGVFIYETGPAVSATVPADAVEEQHNLQGPKGEVDSDRQKLSDIVIYGSMSENCRPADAIIQMESYSHR